MIIGQKKDLTKTIRDNCTNETVTFFYRRPTTKERNGYANEAVQVKRNKVIRNLSETRIKYASKIVTGVKPGDIQMLQNGANVPLVTDPTQPSYVENWKGILEEHLGHMLEHLGASVFEGGTEEDADEDDEKN